MSCLHKYLEDCFLSPPEQAYADCIPWNDDHARRLLKRLDLKYRNSCLTHIPYSAKRKCATTSYEGVLNENYPLLNSVTLGVRN